MRNPSLFCFALLFLSTAVFAQTDVPGSTDHPLLTRYPGAHIAWYQTEKYLEYDLATGPITGYRTIGQREKHAGQVYRIYYEVPGGPEEVSIGEVYADYLKAFQRAGVKVLAKALDPKANEFGGNQWVGVALAPQQPPHSAASKLFAGTSTAGGKFAIVGRLERPSGPVLVAIYGERHSDQLVNYLVDIIETNSAELGQVSINPDYLADELTARGSVSIYGINFGFDSATLEADADAVLDQIAAYLRARPQVQLFVVGHTDMTGSLDYNRKLSLARASAVVARLESHYRITKGRLLPEGLAFLAPKATNDSDAGRALNRRVELVLRK
ncbi:OmpA family protein [Neolewinella lacunae]|uniref:OmpA family protein n=1 Tax=Neolewinella lacunae TaxID=1517758 RepID=A0A923PER0_9BACT|nr:OmpA family protein [Neolewinella lacunae]MBC6992702.1 OmpA family protein [Neolewinella lacunae]MDN3633582.1 OmpA family protein [Neolewinella lacunae]